MAATTDAQFPRPELEARRLSDHAVGLVMSLTLAHDRKQSSAAVALFADAARLELRWIKVRLAVIETAVAALPTASRLRGAN